MSFKIHVSKRNILLLIILGVGAFLRFYRLSEAIGWWGDAARDYLVAYHLGVLNESLIVGHFATGILGGFYHPPYYYYLLSLLVRIRESPVFVTGTFTLLHVLSILTMYKIGKTTYDDRTGLLSAALFAVSSSTVNISRALISANITLPFAMLALLFYLRSIKYFDKTYAYAAFALLLIALYFWYGILLLMLYVFIHVSWKFRGQYQFLITLLIYIFIGLCITEFPLVLFFGIDRIFSIFLPQHVIHFSPTIIASVIAIIGSYFQTVFDQNYYFVCIGVVTLILLLLFLLWKSKKSLLALSLPVLAIIFVAVLCSLKSGGFLAHYITAFEPFAYLIFGYILMSAIRAARGSELWQAFVVCCCIVFVFSISNNFSYIKYIPSDYVETQKVINNMLSYTKGLPLQIAASAPDTPPGWESPAFWYFLEKKTGRPHVHVVNSGENLAPDNRQYIYLAIVCKNFGSSQRNYACYNALHEKYPQYALIQTLIYKWRNAYVVYIAKMPS